MVCKEAGSSCGSGRKSDEALSSSSSLGRKSSGSGREVSAVSVLASGEGLALRSVTSSASPSFITMTLSSSSLEDRRDLLPDRSYSPCVWSRSNRRMSSPGMPSTRKFRSPSQKAKSSSPIFSGSSPLTPARASGSNWVRDSTWATSQHRRSRYVCSGPLARCELTKTRRVVSPSTRRVETAPLLPM